MDLSDRYNKQSHHKQNMVRMLSRIEQLNHIGIALSAEQDKNHLLETILSGAQYLTNADAGTLYLLEQQKLHFKIINNRSLAIEQSAEDAEQQAFPPIPLYDESGQPNQKTVAAYAALTGTTINIPDIRANSEFDFSGTLSYDKKSGYRSQSFLTIPMRDHEDEIIGVLQLINPTEQLSNNILAFSDEDQQLVESLASQAAVAITNQRLIAELKNLMEKFIEVIASAIDDKSPYTGYHCRRVPEIAMLLADAINENKVGPLADFNLDDKQRYELKIAALLHDCGKITTPVHVVDKATKLETIFDRIHLIESRYEILRRDIEIAGLKQQLRNTGSNHDSGTLNRPLQILDEEFEFLKNANKGTEFMPEAAQQRVREIGNRTWQNQQGETRPLLNSEEIDNLTIAKGTLLESERQIINHHISMTINMLEALPFPKHLSNVPEIAGNHHERMDGKGYPRGLKRDEMSIQARLMGIADIFEALTASDRPYKSPMRLSQALKILANMAEEGHIDPDLFEIFVSQKVYLRYAEKNLRPEQIDDIDFNGPA